MVAAETPKAAHMPVHNLKKSRYIKIKLLKISAVAYPTVDALRVTHPAVSTSGPLGGGRKEGGGVAVLDVGVGESHSNPNSRRVCSSALEEV